MFWIRSQDKRLLENVVSLYVCKYYGSYIISNYPEEYPNNNAQQPIDCVKYGVYSTKKRALEILDEIGVLIDQLNKIDFLTQIEVMNLQTVYEMPKE